MAISEKISKRNLASACLIAYIILLLMSAFLLSVAGDYVVWFAVISTVLIPPILIGNTKQRLLVCICFAINLFLILHDNQAGKQRYQKQLRSIGQDKKIQQINLEDQHDIFSGIPNFPVLALETTNIVEVFRYLQDYADKSLPKDKRIEIILNLPVKDFPRYPKTRDEVIDTIQSPDMTPVNISFKDALKYICRAANLKMKISGRRVIISQSN